MPRSVSDGGHNAGIFRSVFARSPLGQSTTSEDSVQAAVSPTSTSSSWTTPSTTAQFRHVRRGSDQSLEVPVLHHTRSRSYSHRDLKRPSLSMSKLSLQVSADVLSNSPNSVVVETPDAISASWEDSFGRILHHAEAQITHSGWRKKYEYLVLTEYYLFRFKSAKKASEMFPWILPAHAHMYRPESAQSLYAVQDVEPSSGTESPTDLSTGKSAMIPLQDIIATQFISDNRMRVGIEIIRQSQSHKTSSSISIFVDRVGGQPHWIESIGEAAQNAQAKRGNSTPAGFLQTIRDAVGPDAHEALNTPNDNLFVVHLRQNQLNENSPSALEELTKDHHTLIFLLIGTFKVHIITVPKSQRGSSKSLNEGSKLNISSYGIVSLTCVSVSEKDDSFDLVFRKPQRPAVSLELASVHSHSIAKVLHTQLGFLQPNWKRDPYLFRVPAPLQHQLSGSESTTASTAETFLTTLEAFCFAFDVNYEGLKFSIDLECDDSPAISLVPRSDSFAVDYSIPEIMAFMRALRYNEYFGSISFSGISLDRLADSFDRFGDEHIVTKPKMGSDIIIAFEEMKHNPILFQEITAMVMTSRKLRRLDFSNSIMRIPNPTLDQTGEDKGCVIVESLYPLCANQNTNVDWIILSGIHLAKSDFEYIMAMISRKDCHIRAIELSGCHIDVFNMRLLVQSLPTQHNTLEVIDISNNPGRISPGITFPTTFMECKAMKRLNLSGLHVTPEPTSLISFEVFSSWRLEELRLTKTRINDATLATLISYLESDVSRSLKKLYVDQCQLNVEGITKLFHAINRNYNGDRNLHLDVSENYIRSFDPIIEAIRSNVTPQSLALRAVEFDDEATFQELAQAIRSNSSLRVLDLSETQLVFRIDDNMSSLLRTMFAENNALEEIDLSGENSRLETSSFGSGFFEALRGLAQNKRLRVLRVRHQKLSLQGANALAEVLRSNETLREIHCDNNKIPLAGLTILNDALRSNYALTFLSDMEDSKQAALHTIQSVMRSMAEPSSPNAQPGISMPKLVKVPTALLGRLSKSPKEKEALPPDVIEAKAIVEDKWENQQRTLKELLERNKRISTGEIDLIGADDNETASSTCIGSAISTSTSSTGLGVHMMGVEVPRQQSPDQIENLTRVKIKEGLGTV